MDKFNQIEQNNYSNFGEDMYGTSVKVPVHSYRSLYSKQPIYFTDYGSGGYSYPVYGRRGWRSQFYAKPPSGGIWAADGSASESESESVSPSGTSLSSKIISDDSIKIIVGGIIGAIGGYFVAKAENQSLVAGALIGGGLVAGASMLLNESEK